MEIVIIILFVACAIWLVTSERVAPVCDICHVRIAALAIHSCSGNGAASGCQTAINTLRA
jgi:hypothetical protein